MLYTSWSFYVGAKTRSGSWRRPLGLYYSNKDTSTDYKETELRGGYGAGNWAQRSLYFGSYVSQPRLQLNCHSICEFTNWRIPELYHANLCWLRLNHRWFTPLMWQYSVGRRVKCYIPLVLVHLTLSWERWGLLYLKTSDLGSYILA